MRLGMNAFLLTVDTSAEALLGEPIQQAELAVPQSILECVPLASGWNTGHKRKQWSQWHLFRVAVH
jgi:hypothetical protein